MPDLFWALGTWVKEIDLFPSSHEINILEGKGNETTDKETVSEEAVM